MIIANMPCVWHFGEGDYANPSTAFTASPMTSRSVCLSFPGHNPSQTASQICSCLAEMPGPGRCWEKVTLGLNVFSLSMLHATPTLKWQSYSLIVLLLPVKVPPWTESKQICQDFLPILLISYMLGECFLDVCIQPFNSHICILSSGNAVPLHSG